jgi:hypothetical protein
MVQPGSLPPGSPVPEKGSIRGEYMLKKTRNRIFIIIRATLLLSVAINIVLVLKKKTLKEMKKMIVS